MVTGRVDVAQRRQHRALVEPVVVVPVPGDEDGVRTARRDVGERDRAIAAADVVVVDDDDGVAQVLDLAGARRAVRLGEPTLVEVLDRAAGPLVRETGQVGADQHALDAPPGEVGGELARAHLLGRGEVEQRLALAVAHQVGGVAGRPAAVGQAEEEFADGVRHGGSGHLDKGNGKGGNGVRPAAPARPPQRPAARSGCGARRR